MKNHAGIIELDTLRRSRDFLQSVIDNIGDPTMVIDINRHILLANKAIKKIIDGSGDPVAGHLCCFEFIHRLERPCPDVCPGAYPCPVNEVISTLMPSRVLHTLRNSLDNEIFMEVIASPVFDDSGEIVQIVESFHNIARFKEERERLEDLVLNLQNVLAKAKRLAGLLPICMTCKRIRSEKGNWENIEVYIRNHSEAEFTHGLCSECEEKIYGLRKEKGQ